MSDRTFSLSPAIRALIRRDLAGYFQSPVAYVLGVIFLIVTGGLFFSTFFLFDRVELRGFFSLLPVLLGILVPALAMRLIAEERRRGTWEVLQTLPLTTVHIVVGKFIALWVTALFLLAPTVLFALSVSMMGRLDGGPVVGGYVGAVLLAGAYSAVGLFASAIARSETVALVVALVISLVLVLLGNLLILIPTPLVPLMEYLSVTYHFAAFTRGVIDSRSVVYFGSVIALFLILTTYRLDREREEQPR